MRWLRGEPGTVEFMTAEKPHAKTRQKVCGWFAGVRRPVTEACLDGALFTLAENGLVVPTALAHHARLVVGNSVRPHLTQE
jgi:hypothetical protein